MANHDFESVLSRYQQNLTEYKTTGNGALKQAVDTDKAWLDSYIASIDQRSQQQQNYIQKFVSEYKNTNPELVQMQAKLKEIRQKGPVLQDAYETEMQAQEDEPIDYTPYYVKGALIVGVAVVVGVVSALRPTYVR